MDKNWRIKHAAEADIELDPEEVDVDGESYGAADDLKQRKELNRLRRTLATHLAKPLLPHGTSRNFAQAGAKVRLDVAEGRRTLAVPAAAVVGNKRARRRGEAQ